MLKKLTTYYSASLIVAMLLLVGCVAPHKYFPEEPVWEPYTVTPVLAYTNNTYISYSNDVYIVTPAFVDNAVKQTIFIGTINDWRKNNGIP